MIYVISVQGQEVHICLMDKLLWEFFSQGILFISFYSFLSNCWFKKGILKRLLKAVVVLVVWGCSV